MRISNPTRPLLMSQLPSHIRTSKAGHNRPPRAGGGVGTWNRTAVRRPSRSRIVRSRLWQLFALIGTLISLSLVAGAGVRPI